jgi:hypothetical protein
MKERLVFLFSVAVFLLMVAGFAWADCQGDVDCDGDVDGNDLRVLASEIGTADCGGSSTIVTFSDYSCPPGLSKTFNRKIFTDQEPGFYEEYFSTIINEGAVIFTYQDGAKDYYYPDRREYYNSDGDLLGTVLFEPKFLFPIAAEFGSRRIGESWGNHFISTFEDGYCHVYTFGYRGRNGSCGNVSELYQNFCNLWYRFLANPMACSWFWVGKKCLRKCGDS